MRGVPAPADDGAMEHERRDVSLGEVVEVLRQADTADGLLHLHHLLAPDVVLRTCDAVVIGAEAVISTVTRWVEAHGGGWEVLDVVDGGDRVAVRFERAGRPGALFLSADEQGRLAAATLAPSAR